MSEHIKKEEEEEDMSIKSSRLAVNQRASGIPRVLIYLYILRDRARGKGRSRDSIYSRERERGECDGFGRFLCARDIGFLRYGEGRLFA